MTEEELRWKIENVISEAYKNSPWPDEVADQILTLIKEAGWKSPSDIQKMIDMVKLGMEAQ
jgi:hypothetical protein